MCCEQAFEVVIFVLNEEGRNTAYLTGSVKGAIASVAVVFFYKTLLLFIWVILDVDWSPSAAKCEVLNKTSWDFDIGWVRIGNR